LITSYLGTLTIANGGTQSNVLSNSTLRTAEWLIFDTPSAFTGTVSVYGALDNDAVIGAMKACYRDGTAVTIGANRVDRCSVGGLSSVAIVSGSAEGAQRDVKVYAVLHVE
jgi:hypothetical protein